MSLLMKDYPMAQQEIAVADADSDWEWAKYFPESSHPTVCDFQDPAFESCIEPPVAQAQHRPQDSEAMTWVWPTMPSLEKNLVADCVPSAKASRNRSDTRLSGGPLCCWEHGCDGRVFSSKSNLRRHQKEASRAGKGGKCPLCGAIFTRKSARDTHLGRQSCGRIRRYSNGRVRPSLFAMLSNPDLTRAAQDGVPLDDLSFVSDLTLGPSDCAIVDEPPPDFSFDQLTDSTSLSLSPNIRFMAN